MQYIRKISKQAPKKITKEEAVESYKQQMFRLIEKLLPTNPLCDLSKLPQ